MKNHRFILISIISLMLIALSVSVFAQPGPRGFQQGDRFEGRRGPFIPDLTEEQEAQIKDLRTKHLQDVLPVKNELGELRAELRTLKTAEKVNMNAIYKKIDEMGVIQTKIRKKGATHHQNIRTLLTDEQRVFFDSRAGRGGKGGHFAKGRRGGRGGRGFGGQGRGPGRGFGPCNQF